MAIKGESLMDVESLDHNYAGAIGKAPLSAGL